MTYTIQELTAELLQSQTDDYIATLANLTTVAPIAAEKAVQLLQKINGQ
jgi:hypothetical protein